MNADKARARGVVAQFTGLAPQLVEAMPPIAWSSRINLAKWRQLVELLKEQGELQSTPNPEDYFSAGVKKRLGSRG